MGCRTSTQVNLLPQNGLASGLPYLVKWGVMVYYPRWLDRQMAEGRLDLRRARRLSTFLGNYVIYFSQ